MREGTSGFAVGEFLIRNEQKTDIKVESIGIFFGKVTIKLSDKSKIVFAGMPYSYSN